MTDVYDEARREVAKAMLGVDEVMESMVLPRGKYWVMEAIDGWHIFHEDNHGAYT